MTAKFRMTAFSHTPFTFLNEKLINRYSIVILLILPNCLQNTLVQLLPERQYLRGILGTRPVTSDGTLYDVFLKQWNEADPDVYYGAGNTSFSQYPEVML